jgi:hypothetical protein
MPKVAVHPHFKRWEIKSHLNITSYEPVTGSAQLVNLDGGYILYITNFGVSIIKNKETLDNVVDLKINQPRTPRDMNTMTDVCEVNRLK